MEDPKRTRKQKLFLFLKVFGLVLITVVLILGAISAFSFIRHRQLCSYQTLVDSNLATVSADVDLCPNLLATQDWTTILQNALNFRVLDSLSLTSDEGAEVVVASECTDQLNPLCWVTGTKPQLEETDGFTNLLLVGLDTRPTGPGGGLQNTDTIMLVSYQHSTGKLLFTSFPRDLNVHYYRTNGVFVNYKINAIYAIDGVEGLNYTVEQITGKPIHYYAYVHLGLFTEVIDRLGGVEITLEEPFEDRYPCGDEPPGVECPQPIWITDGYFGLFKFPAGTQTFDSFEAGVYVRSRKLSSDYGRAQRQQLLVKAMMKSALNNDQSLIEKVNLYFDLYNIFQEEVLTNVELEDVAAVFALVESIDTDAAHIVVDPELGGLNQIVHFIGILPDVGWSIGFVDTTHQQYQNYVEQIWSYLPYYIEKPRILIINASGAEIDPVSSLGLHLAKPNPFATIEIQQAGDGEYQDVVGAKIYDMSSGAATGSLKDYKNSLPGSLVYSAQLDGIEQSEFGEDILIIWGGEISE